MNRAAIIKALRDTAQSASNTAAENVSVPVDMLANGMRKVGMPIPENPVMGSRWMARHGLTAPVDDGIPKKVGETLGLMGSMAPIMRAKAR